jgi:hypothetical protein
MKSSSSACRYVARVVGVLIVGSFLSAFLWSFSCVAGFAQSVTLSSTPSSPAQTPSQAVAQPPSERSLKAWRETMSRIPRPKKGCFKSLYPSIEWQETQCTTPSPLPYPPRSGARPENIGNGTNFSAQVGGHISSAVGSFDSVTGVTNDFNAIPNFSLQLNTQFFNTAACDVARKPSACLGWQQFLYNPIYAPFSSDFDFPNVYYGQAYMQYWLINFGDNCPLGWRSYDGSYCYRNSYDAVLIPPVTLADLRYLTLAGSTALGTDTVTMSRGSEVFTATGQDSVLNLQQVWQFAEFNVFGNCCSSQFNYNKGSTIVVRTSVDDGTTNPPTCVRNGLTGETNNLTLVNRCCTYGGSSPSIVFTESNAAGAMATCVAATNVATVQNVLQEYELRRRVGALVPIIEYAKKSLP